ncbi:restriction endonuclease [Corynebacterium flavescens]
MYLITKLGEGLLQLPEEKALEKVRDLDRDYYRQQRQRKLSDSAQNSSRQIEDSQPSAEVLADTESDKDATGSEWKAQLLDRLHRLSPEGFEKFVLYLLRRYGLQLTHMGGSGDEGIDGIGTTPLSPVLSSRVAVQVKRYAHKVSRLGAKRSLCFKETHKLKAQNARFW